MWLFKIVANMRDSFKSVLIRFSLAWMPTTQFLVNDRDPAEDVSLSQIAIERLTISQ